MERSLLVRGVVEWGVVEWGVVVWGVVVWGVVVWGVVVWGVVVWGLLVRGLVELLRVVWDELAVERWIRPPYWGGRWSRQDECHRAEVQLNAMAP